MAATYIDIIGGNCSRERFGIVILGWNILREGTEIYKSHFPDKKSPRKVETLSPFLKISFWVFF
jgi:hypothetical protein